MEYPQHKRAKDRLKEILKTTGYENIQMENKQVEIKLEFLGKRTYTVDIEAEKEGRIYIFEIDGKKGHSSRWNVSKDKTRDRAMSDIGKRTVRIKTWWLVGRGCLSDLDILKEIEWQLSHI